MGKVTFYTEQYEAVHGKKPSGLGRWAFRITGTDNEIWLNGKYSNIKKQVEQQVKAFGFERVDVLA